MWSNFKKFFSENINAKIKKIGSKYSWNIKFNFKKSIKCKNIYNKIFQFLLKIFINNKKDKKEIKIVKYFINSWGNKKYNNLFIAPPA